MATYAIGDVQGCYDELCLLLDSLKFEVKKDRLWFVGDLVNRGPHSLETLRFVRSLGAAAITVLGNHDLHLIMQGEGFGERTNEDTLDAVLNASDRDELLAWLRERPLFHVEGEYAMVHAGLLPQWSIDKAVTLSEEVHSVLMSSGYQEFLAHMWGSTPPGWHEGLVGWDRLRVIVNVMTRMRFCTQNGIMEFHCKGPPQRAPVGYLPWFEIPGRISSDRTIICGHWSALGLRLESNLLALDSGCLWGGALSAVCLEDRRLLQQPSLRGHESAQS